MNDSTDVEAIVTYAAMGIFAIFIVSVIYFSTTGWTENSKETPKTIEERVERLEHYKGIVE